MLRSRRLLIISSSVAVLLTAGIAALLSAPPAREPMIRETVSEYNLATLAGNTRPEATAENDLGMVNDDLVMDHMLLQLQRAPAQEQALQQLIAEQQDPQSPDFHKWLSASEFGQRFGVAESDIRTITNWLESRGFT